MVLNKYFQNFHIFRLSFTKMWISKQYHQLFSCKHLDGFYITSKSKGIREDTHFSFGIYLLDIEYRYTQMYYRWKVLSHLLVVPGVPPQTWLFLFYKKE